MNKKVAELENIVTGMAKKIFELRNKLKETESKESEVKEMNEFDKIFEHTTKVSNHKDNPKTPKSNKEGKH